MRLRHPSQQRVRGLCIIRYKQATNQLVTKVASSPLSAAYPSSQSAVSHIGAPQSGPPRPLAAAALAPLNQDHPDPLLLLLHRYDELDKPPARIGQNSVVALRKSPYRSSCAAVHAAHCTVPKSKLSSCCCMQCRQQQLITARWRLLCALPCRTRVQHPKSTCFSWHVPLLVCCMCARSMHRWFFDVQIMWRTLRQPQPNLTKPLRMCAPSVRHGRTPACRTSRSC